MMKKLITCMLIALMMFAWTSNVKAADPRLSSWQEKSMKSTTIMVHDVEVPIFYGSPTYYITSNNHIDCRYLLYIGVNDNAQNKLIGLGGRVCEVKFASSDPKIASVDQYGRVTFLSPGQVVFTVTIEDSAAEIPVQVFEGPWIIDVLEGKEVSVEAVVRKLGFPQERTKTDIVWPNRSAVLDDIYYAFGGTTAVFLEHWHYDSHPSLLFRIQANSVLKEIKNVGWDSGYESSVRYSLGIPF